MTAGSEFGKALRSLPWYLVGSYLITPLVAALFTLGVGLALYAFPFMMFSSSRYGHGDDALNVLMGFMPFLPGLAIWVIRQFVRAAMFTFASNRRAY